MIHFSWRNRCVMLLNGNYILSARGDFNDFDFFAGDSGSAVQGNINGPNGEVLRVKDIQFIDEDRLRFVTRKGNYVLHGDDFFGKTDNPARIVREDPIIRTVGIDQVR